MKKIKLLILSISICSTFNSFSQTYIGKEAEGHIQGTRLIEYSNKLNKPIFIELSSTSKYKKNLVDPAEAIKDLLRLKKEDQLVILKQENDDLGFTHTKYQQYYNNIAVEGGEYIAHVKSGELDCINGFIFDINNVLTTPAITLTEALDKAISYVGAKKYKWDNYAEINQLRKIFNDPTLNFDPKGVLVIYPENNNYTNNGNFKLAYKFDIYAEEPESRAYVFIDAQTGMLIGKKNLIHTADTPGTAKTKYSGTRTITTDKVSPTSFRLQETGRGLGIQTWNLKTAKTVSTAVDFTDSNNNWDTVNVEMDEVATDAHWATEMTYDYYKNIHNRNSIDNNGFKLLNYVHYDKKWQNAAWNGLYMYYGDGPSNKPLTTLDIGAHEMSHGLTTRTANLDYQDESGALNESFSDIFGTCVEFFAKPTTANWDIGEDIGAIRSMKYPKSHSNPDTYEGEYWHPLGGGSDKDYGGVHSNSGVQNHWFYILANGKSGRNDKGGSYSVPGIGIDKASKIAFKTLTVYLTSTSNYAAARINSLKAATDLYGNCSPEYIATVDAWYAVGVGGLSGCPVAPIAEFFAANTSTCTNPTVEFTDWSGRGPTKWLWDFGDSQTSNLQYPTHTYAANGLYTVKLTVENQYGISTKTKTAYININLLNGLPTVTPTSRCGAGVVNLNASTTSGNIEWYEDAKSWNVLNSGTSYSPTVNATTTFYVSNTTKGAIQKVGAVDTTFSNSAYFGANDVHGLLFDVFQPIIIKSVKVYSDSIGKRTIEILDSAGTKLFSKVVDIPMGEYRVPLYASLPVGKNLFIKMSGINFHLKRNAGGASFPYTIPGLVSITETDIGTTTPKYYYFFYEWEVQSTGCQSQRVAVTATVNPALTKPTITLKDATTVSGPVGYTYKWYLNGTIINGAINQTYTPTVTGDYTVEIFSDPNCSAISDLYHFTVLGINNHSELTGISIYPNPTNSVVYIDAQLLKGNDDLQVTIYTIVGKTVFNKTFKAANQLHKIDLSTMAEGVYFVKLQSGTKMLTEKINLIH